MHQGLTSRQGIILATGLGIKANFICDRANVEDLTPTVLHILNVPIPSDMDGHVLAELYAPGSELEAREVTYQSPSGEVPKSAGFDEFESAEVERRLKALGYLG